MNEQIMRETGRVLFHLNGYTKVMLERTEGVGMANFGIVWDIETELIPFHLRQIGSRFIVQYTPLSPEEMNDPAALHDAKNRVEIFELNEE